LALVTSNLARNWVYQSAIWQWRQIQGGPKLLPQFFPVTYRSRRTDTDNIIILKFTLLPARHWLTEAKMKVMEEKTPKIGISRKKYYWCGGILTSPRSEMLI